MSTVGDVGSAFDLNGCLGVEVTHFIGLYL